MLLEKQKNAALSILKDSAKYERQVELVRDDTFNAGLQAKIEQVDVKIDQLDMLFTQLVNRGKYVGRE